MAAPNPRTPRQPIPYRTGVIARIGKTLKLFVRLLLDPQVSIFLKLIPLGILAYWISPWDRAIPVVDDLLIAVLGVLLFVLLCPPEIVARHRQATEDVLEGKWRDAQDDEKIAEEDIIDGEFREK